MNILFDHLENYFQTALEPESHHPIDEYMWKFKAKALWDNTWRTNPSDVGSSSGFEVALNLDIYATWIYTWVNKGAQNLVFENVVVSLCQTLKKYALLCSFDICFASPKLLINLSEMGIYPNGLVRANRKHMPILTLHKQMKRGEHDWLSANGLLVIKRMDNKSVMLLKNYFNPKTTQEIDRRVKWDLIRKWRFHDQVLFINTTNLWVA